MNATTLTKRIQQLAPTLTDVRAEVYKCGKKGHVVATKDKMMRCAYWERGLTVAGGYVIESSDEQVAAKVAKELMA